MYRVKNLRNDEVKEFNYIEDFLESIRTDEIVIEWMNQISPSIEIPYIGEMSVGELIYKLTNGYKGNADYQVDWDNVINDWLDIETDFLKSDLENPDEPIRYGDYEVTFVEDE